MKKIFGTLFLMFSSYTFINAQKHFPIDVISNYGKKIIAEGSSITFNDSTVIFVTSLGGKVNKHNLIIISKDEDKKPPV